MSTAQVTRALQRHPIKMNTYLVETSESKIDTFDITLFYGGREMSLRFLAPYSPHPLRVSYVLDDLLEDAHIVDRDWSFENHIEEYGNPIQDVEPVFATQEEWDKAVRQAKQLQELLGSDYDEFMEGPEE